MKMTKASLVSRLVFLLKRFPVIKPWQHSASTVIVHSTSVWVVWMTGQCHYHSTQQSMSIQPVCGWSEWLVNVTVTAHSSQCPLSQCVGGLNGWSMSLSQHTAVNVHSTSVWVVRMAKSVSVAQHTRIINALYSMKQYTIIMPSSLQTVYVTCLTVMISARNRYLDTRFNTWVSLSTRLYFLKS